MAVVELTWCASRSLPGSRIVAYVFTPCQNPVPLRLLAFQHRDVCVFIRRRGPAVSAHAEARQQLSDDTRVYYAVIYTVWFYGGVETLSTSYGSYLYTCVTYRDQIGPAADENMFYFIYIIAFYPTFSIFSMESG